MPDDVSCRICGGDTAPAGSKRGSLNAKAFRLRRCRRCGFGFVVDPEENSELLYDERYYRGHGADPLVDYVFELEHPEATIRRSEWEGIVEVVRALTPIGPATRWLDYGCGNGGLVRHLRDTAICDAAGFESGWIADRARSHGIPLLSAEDLRSQRGRYDVVTAIEAIEHVADPLPMLRAVRDLLKPGGLLFLTTGNAAAHADLTRWGYVRPDIHVSFFEPRTLERAFEMTGFRPQHRGFLPGFEKIIRFKILKELGIRRERRALDIIPWGPLARLADASLAISAHPIAWAV
jgi:SAM-dependent methyltransferase